MPVTFSKIAKLVQRNLAWMGESVQQSFEHELNVATITQICCYTEALSRFWVGTVVESPTDGPKVFCGFMRQYFHEFNKAAGSLGRFYINKNRGAPGGKAAEVDAFEAFYFLYRHGLVHEYLQKAGSFITRTSDAGEQPYLRVQPNPRGVVDPHHHKTRRLHVHLDPLVVDFRRAVKEYLEDLVTRPGRRRLQANCCRRYSFILR